MHRQSIGPRQHTPIDTFLWSVAGAEVYVYDTAVGEQFAQGYEPGDLPAADARKLTNLRYLQEHHGGALAVYIELSARTHAIPAPQHSLISRDVSLTDCWWGDFTCQHKAGMKFVSSFRTNQHYGAVEDAAHPCGSSSMRRNRPDLMIYHPDELLPDGGLEWGIRTGLNFAEEEVRRLVYETRHF